MSISNKCSETDNAQLRMDNEQLRTKNFSFSIYILIIFRAGALLSLSIINILFSSLLYYTLLCALFTVKIEVLTAQMRISSVIIWMQKKAGVF